MKCAGVVMGLFFLVFSVPSAGEDLSWLGLLGEL